MQRIDLKLGGANTLAGNVTVNGVPNGTGGFTDSGRGTCH